mgnify:CR=1 FL=1|tara:strand:+ start:1049 stop:1264 length:216 start_codon:yes stop_codon:yes gene_type:complete
MKKLSETQAILAMLIVIGIYTICVWHSALHYYPIKMQIEVNDWKQRNTECHWQLLDSQARNKKLRERLKLK